MPPVADLLKQETAAAHRHAETRELQKQLIKATIPVEALGRYLAQLRAIHSALECALDGHVGDALVDPLWPRDLKRHSESLVDDLRRLETDAQHPCLPVAAALVRYIDSAAPVEVIGVLYVLEGSMNGNRFIARAMAGARLLSDGPPSYLDPYGEAQPQRWGEFREALNTLPLNEMQREQMLGSARRTFAAVADIADAALSG